MNRPALEKVLGIVDSQPMSTMATLGDLHYLLDALLAPDAASADITGLVSGGAPRIPPSVYGASPRFNMHVYVSDPRPVALWETA